MAETAVLVERLTKKFPGVTAVDALSFDVCQGEIFGLVGPDGAGKTTTLRILAGVLPADAGRVEVGGHDVARDPERVREAISYMPQRFGLYDDLTVEENIRFYADLFGVARRAREVRQARLLAASGMSEFRRRLAGKLSGGMKQKLGLTCALIHTPRVLLLDEPTTGVDPISRRDFWRILYSLLAEGVTILTSTAYLDEAERCHRVALMHQGRRLLCDTPEKLKARLPARSVLGVAAPDPRAVRDALAEAEGIQRILLAGDHVRVGVAGGEQRIPELRRLLTAKGVAFDDVRVMPPTLEDLFVASVEGIIAPES